jgi:hypothetical protein
MKVLADAPKTCMSVIWRSTLIHARDKELVDCFDDYWRSTAFLQTAKLHSRKLLTEAELMQFSEQTAIRPSNSVQEPPESGRRTPQKSIDQLRHRTRLTNCPNSWIFKS